MENSSELGVLDKVVRRLGMLAAFLLVVAVNFPSIIPLFAEKAPSLSEWLENLPLFVKIVLTVAAILYVVGDPLLRHWLNRPRLARRVQCRQGWSDGRWMTLTIHNKSRQDLVGCEAVLVSVTRDEEELSLRTEVELLWSIAHKERERGDSEREQRGGTRTIPVSDPRMTVDIAHIKHGKDTVEFDTQKGDPPSGSAGIYEAKIELHGNYGGRPFTSDIIVVQFTYEGGSDLSCGEPKWLKVKTKYT